MEWLALLFSGFALGLSGGLTPGPLLTLVISQTLRFGMKEGAKIAFAPLITDFPIILIAVFALSKLSDIGPVLGAITLLGGLFLVYLGWESVSFGGVEYRDASIEPKSFRKGVIANFLNPSPYLFWFTIGAPMLVKFEKPIVPNAFLFIASLYIALVGSKILVVILVNRSRTFLKSRNYVYTLKFLGIVLWFFAVVFLKDSMEYFGVL